MRLPDGSAFRLRVRSMVGLLPLAALAIFEEDELLRLTPFRQRAQDCYCRHSDLCSHLHMPSQPGMVGRRMLSVLTESKLRRVLARMLDDAEFLSPYGICSLSRDHLDHPFSFNFQGQEFRVEYQPGDSTSAMFGGNSYWRGPIWMPVNLILILALYTLYAYSGDAFQVERPTESGRLMTLFEAAQDLSERLVCPYLPDQKGRGPVPGNCDKFQSDPHWCEPVLFYEYFHGETGAGLGASHQTGWIGCIDRILQVSGDLTQDILMGAHAEMG